ncbi:hypothetical protein KIL84_002506 [Mauremys mutica]|uniref:Uncharacterized protein n=1 Tax=Mauremys mutica TaxID=74926 RepID=A0A9D3X7P3_9SAUR|nr:hypothetical protein KIL84_002506 [Mauremys mutica]
MDSPDWAEAAAGFRKEAAPCQGVSCRARPPHSPTDAHVTDLHVSSLMGKWGQTSLCLARARTMHSLPSHLCAWPARSVPLGTTSLNQEKHHHLEAEIRPWAALSAASHVSSLLSSLRSSALPA